MKPINQTPVKQRGAALAIGLILLAVTSLVTVTAINTGVMQERMSANQDNHARAFMAAEAGGARLIAELNKPNGWPTSNTHPLPGTHRLIADDPSITFTLTLVPPPIPSPPPPSPPPPLSWTDSPLNVRIEGFARSADGSAVLARTQLLVSLGRQTVTTTTPGGPPPPAANPVANAPAAISCFGGPCRITAGAGRGADEGFGTVSGFDHPIPPLSCSGAGCRMQPQGTNRTRPAVPAVFFYRSHDLRNEPPSRISRSGGGNFNAFQGLNQAGNGIVRGNDMSVAISHVEDPNSEDSIIDRLNSVFGPPEHPATSSVPTTSRLESGRSTLTELGGSNFEVGTLVLDGQNLAMQGNALFVGLIVIRNCGTLRMGGNPNIYGAVIVEAVRTNGTACPTDYDPFGGQGTPALRFSRAALERAANPPGTGTGPGPGTSTSTSTTRVNVLRWVEILE